MNAKDPADAVREAPMIDTFNGDNAHLIECIAALLSLDAAGALVPHGIGGHARVLLESAAVRLAALAAPPAEAPADAVDSITRKLYADMLEGGAIVRIDPSAMFAHGVQWDSGSPCMEPRPVGMVYPPLPPPRASGYLDDSGVEWNAYDTAQMEAYARDAVASYYAAPAAPAEGDVPFDVVRDVVRALSRMGESFPTSQEEQAARSVELIRDLCRSVLAYEWPSAPRVTGGREAQDAARYRWLNGRLLGADFDYGDDDEKCCAVVFHWPENGWISADLDASIDAAMKDTP